LFIFKLLCLVDDYVNYRLNFYEKNCNIIFVFINTALF